MYHMPCPTTVRGVIVDLLQATWGARRRIGQSSLASSLVLANVPAKKIFVSGLQPKFVQPFKISTSLADDQAQAIRGVGRYPR